MSVLLSFISESLQETVYNFSVTQGNCRPPASLNAVKTIKRNKKPDKCGKEHCFCPIHCYVLLPKKKKKHY